MLSTASDAYTVRTACTRLMTLAHDGIDPGTFGCICLQGRGVGNRGSMVRPIQAKLKLFE